MDDPTLDDDIDAEDVVAPDEDELEEDLDDEIEDDLDLPSGEDQEVAGEVSGEDDEDEDEPAVARRKPAGEDDDDDDDELNPDDVEADLDAILKDRIAAGNDDDEDEEEDDRPDAEGGERVAAKSAEEFTCATCFMIVHPRQFGRAGSLSCPEGYDPCPSVKIVEQRLRRAASK